MEPRHLKSTVTLLLGYMAYQAVMHIDPDGVMFSPASWGIVSLVIWAAYVVTRGWSAMSSFDKQQLLWAVCSAVALFHFLKHDPDFKGWGDVYFFCGKQLQYCTCDFRWNVLGWCKAMVLWNFVLTAALGGQRFAILIGLNGLLPGEEVVTKESFISICWRLIPYWLNNWEQSWGAECSSMMFELPHFAVELLVILPCIQILCSRMKILVMPVVALPANDDQHGAQREDFDRTTYAPSILKGYWEHRPEQKRFAARLRANAQLMMFTVAITSLAALNALCVPLYLEHQITLHPNMAAIRMAGDSLPWANLSNSSAVPSVELLVSAGITDPEHHRVLMARLSLYKPLEEAAPSSLNISLAGDGGISGSDFYAQPLLGNLTATDADAGLAMMLGAWNVSASAATGAAAPEADAVQPAEAQQKTAAPRCSGMRKLELNTKKHAEEMRKMQDPRHIQLIPLVESALAMMRLSCEKYFVLLAVFVAYLLFKEPPRAARLMIRLISRMSTVFQKAILYSFPAVCWAYGAGFIFSTFVSVVFWGGPLLYIYQAVRRNSSTVRIRALKDATLADIERMGGNCAICWGEMIVPGSAPVGAGQQGPGQDERDTDGREGAGDEEPAGGGGGGGGGLQEAMQGPAAQQQQQQGDAAARTSSSGSMRHQHGRPEGFSLPCSHAYHYSCLNQWLHQCHTQGTTPKCPMCQAVIQLEVKWRFPFPRRWLGRGSRGADGHHEDLDEAGEEGGLNGGGPGGGHGGELLVMNPNDALNPDDLQMLGLLDHQREVQEMLRDMPQILPPGGAMAEAPQQLQLQALQAERAELLQERQQLVERRRLLQLQLEQQQAELQRLQAEQARALLLEGHLRRQLGQLGDGSGRGGGGGGGDQEGPAAQEAAQAGPGVGPGPDGEGPSSTTGAVAAAPQWPANPAMAKAGVPDGAGTPSPSCLYDSPGRRPSVGMPSTLAAAAAAAAPRGTRPKHSPRKRKKAECSDDAAAERPCNEAGPSHPSAPEAAAASGPGAGGMWVFGAKPGASAAAGSGMSGGGTPLVEVEAADGLLPPGQAPPVQRRRRFFFFKRNK